MKQIIKIFVTLVLLSNICALFLFLLADAITLERIKNILATDAMLVLMFGGMLVLEKLGFFK